MTIAVVTLSKKFFGNHPRAGEPTDFRKKVLNYNKIHTCRINYEFWRKKFEKISQSGGKLSIRQWSGKPYGAGTTMEEVKDIPYENVEFPECGIQKLTMRMEDLTDGDKHAIDEATDFVYKGTFLFKANVDGKKIEFRFLAENDGLSAEDYAAWFLPAFKKVSVADFAIIHFTSYRY